MAGRLEWHGERVLALIEAAAARGIGDGIDMIAETSQDKVPVQTSELKRSQRTDKQGLTGSVYYTDSKAAAAHENLDVRLRNGKTAKYLEKAAHERADDVLRAVAEQIRRVL